MKIISVNLQVNANTAEARKNLSQLGQLLQEIGTTPIQIDSGPISQAVSAAQQLQVHLEKAVNVNTGKIDLSKLNTSLNSSNTNLLTLTTNLQKAGPIGQQAFLKVAQAISSAEAPLVKVNDKLKNFGVTLLNTIKWQLASNLIHGVQGAIEGAVSHAKELNSALSDIRIVTGHSIDYMSKFTAEASKAAQELNTTTTEYSKAALIFFQQGLDGKAVSERVETVIKLSEVTGQSAEKISSQMTAIWNNFDDGSHNLEYYADVITKLGAATAASSDEIANGLSKFASIADTVGLSYEKASASLATVVAETRQSEDVVGTAFKTIFARIQGLSLGETLEDGVDLNKYSKALQTIGVNVLDANGKLKEMDIILNELGKKWQLIGEEQKVATAETVAGVRQYNQFLALMNNYDKVLANEDLAKSSAGTLATQAKIWSESWEAASKRVQKSTQDLYEKILNDQVLIKFEDLFGGLIRGVNNFIDSAGGITPILLSVVGMASSTLFPLLQNGFKQLHNNIKVWTGEAAQDFAIMQGSMSAQMEEMLLKNTSMSESERQLVMIDQELINQKILLTLQSKSMTEAEKLEAENKIRLLEINSNLAKASLERKIALEEELKALEKKRSFEEQYYMALANMKKESANDDYYRSEEAFDEAKKRGKYTTETDKNIKNLTTEIENRNGPDTSDLDKQKQDLEQQLNKASNATFVDIGQTSKLRTEIEEINKAIEEQKQDYQEETKELQKQLDFERQIREIQVEGRKRAREVDSNTVAGDVKTKDHYDTETNPPSNMANQIIENNTSPQAGEDKTVDVSEQKFKDVVEAAENARLAEESFGNMSKELTTILESEGTALKSVNAERIEDIQKLQESVAQKREEANTASKNANAKRKEVQEIQNHIASLKKSKASHDEIKQAKKNLAKAQKDLINLTTQEKKLIKHLEMQ